MSTNDYIAQYRQYFDMDKESQLFEETLSTLQRVTKAREVADVVARLFDVGRINSDLVITKDFIDILIGVATSLEKGKSVNNVREHINNMIARDRWKAREKDNRQILPYKIGRDTVTVNLVVTFDRDKFALFQDIIHQLDMALSAVTVSHFDGDPHTGLPAWQFSGPPASVAAALHRIHDELGADAFDDIRYKSAANRFERGHLTLLQAIQLADHEQQI